MVESTVHLFMSIQKLRICRSVTFDVSRIGLRHLGGLHREPETCLIHREVGVEVRRNKSLGSHFCETETDWQKDRVDATTLGQTNKAELVETKTGLLEG